MDKYEAHIATPNGAGYDLVFDADDEDHAREQAEDFIAPDEDVVSIARIV